jgi:OFA family oxalate/formate antiporter-like MFS transporter
MVIGHATGIIEAVDGTRAFAVGTTSAMAAGNMAGGLGAGVLADRLPLGRMLAALPLLSMAVMLVSSVSVNPGLLLACLVVVGTTYGAIIAIYPVAVLAVAGRAQSSRLYGRVFTSWGLAGRVGPWLAGVLFDATGRYRLPFLVAAACAAWSVICAVSLTRRVSELR